MNQSVSGHSGFVVIVGPDGSGKSSLAARIASREKAVDHEVLHFHWRPGVLPRAGAILRTSVGDPSVPHDRPPRGSGLSVLLLVYYWVDFMLGYWLRIRPVLRRRGMVIMERGWWDFAVDPRRYRLAESPRLVRLLGLLLPQPDLLAVLEAPVEVLLGRKQELPREELTRQASEWRSVRASRTGRKIVLDATISSEILSDDILTRLGDEKELRKGWTGLPPIAARRWTVPRGSRRVASAGLYVYHPITIRGRIGWESARMLAWMGAMRWLSLPQSPDEALWELLAPYISRGGTVSIARANHPGRYVALLLDSSGESTGFAKVATDEHGRAALERERQSIERYGEILPPPLYAPTIQDHRDGVLLLKPVRWEPRPASWRLPSQVSRALGVFFHRTAHHTGEDVIGVSHGDFAPWNVLQTSCGWVLLDWEATMDEAPAFFDIFHYLVQSHQELRRPDRRAILRGIEGNGRLGFLLYCYASASGVHLSTASSSFTKYLRISSKALDPSKRKHRIGLRIREELLAEIEG
jgi:thymidylate kinase